MSDVPEKPHRTGFLWLDLVIGVSAILISLASVWIASRADSTQERLLAASVWPYIQYGTSNLDDAKKPDITLQLMNAGVGPARIRWMSVTYRDRPMASASELLRACCSVAGSPNISRYRDTSQVDHTVLVPHDTVNFIEVPYTPAILPEYRRLDRERFRVQVRVCYCSVLDDCWIMDSREDEPHRDNNCPNHPGPAYTQS
jgi:hypothetical protein